MEEKIELKKRRELDKEYAIVYIIKNKVKVKYDDKITEKKLYTLIGLNLLGERKILDIKIEKEKDNHFWLDILESWRARGVCKIYMLSVEYSKNLERAMKIIFPEGKIVPSMPNIINSIYHYAGGFRSKNSFIKLLKQALIQDTLEEGKIKLDVFKDAYKENIIVSKLIDSNLNNIR